MFQPFLRFWMDRLDVLLRAYDFIASVFQPFLRFWE